MTYSQALEYLDSFINYERITNYRYPENFSLDRMERFLEKLDQPHREYQTLHVAGTKGKGSTCAFVSSILQAAGFKVGLYTSPHLISFRERIQVSGEPIPEQDLVQIVEEIQPRATQDLTYFEVVTGCAFAYFAKRQVDVAVCEVGLGGRLDATNLVHPALTAITPISFDHVEKLGNTLQAIAWEKAGIIKKKVPVVVSPQPRAAWDLIKTVAQEKESRVHRVEQEVEISDVSISPDGTRCTFKTPAGLYPNLRIPLLGRHQMLNAATAVRIAELLKTAGLQVSSAAIEEGIAKTKWLGRCQWVKSSPPILLDGAHNTASASALRSTVEEVFPEKKICLIFGTSTDKDIEGMATILGPWAKELILTRAATSRAESPELLAKTFSPWHPKPGITLSISEALDQARAISGADTLRIVTGSLFLVGEALQSLQTLAPAAAPAQ